MTNTKTTKRALLSSVVALLLCFTMLLGTTFAWFTDTVSNGINKIQSGNLDVNLYYWDLSMDKDVSLADEPNLKLFKNVEGEDILWEPGAVGMGQFMVANEGSLALKYQLTLNFDNATQTEEGKTLADVLSVYARSTYGDGADDGVMEDPDLEELRTKYNSSEIPGYESQALTDFVLEGYLLPGEAFRYELGIEWNPSDIDNEYNVKGGLSIDLGVTLVATQYTYENDAYGDQYDKNAEYPVIALPPITSAEDLQAALNEGGEFVLGADIALDDALTVPAGVKATIDLAGFDLVANNKDGESALIVEGEATLVNTGEEAEVKVNSGTTPNVYPAIEVVKGGILNIQDGEITVTGDRNGSGINSEGEININGGKITVCGNGNAHGIMSLRGSVVNMNDGEIVVDAPVNSKAYGIFAMFGNPDPVEVNLNGGKIIVINGSASHYGVAVMEGSLSLNIAEGFVFDVAEGANKYGSLGASLTLNGVQQ